MENASVYYKREDVLKDLQEKFNFGSWDYEASQGAYSKRDCDKYINLLDAHLFSREEIKSCIAENFLVLDLLINRVQEGSMSREKQHKLALKCIAHDVAMYIIWQSVEFNMVNTKNRIDFWQGVESVSFYLSGL